MNVPPDKNRVFVISELYYPEDTSTGYFITKIAEGLAENHPVEAICSKPTYSERHMNVPFRETHRGVKIRRVRSTRMNKDRIIGRLANLVTFTLGAAWSFARSARRGDIVICLTNPPPLPLLIGAIAKLKKVHSVMLVHDLYPEVLVATGHLSNQSVSYRLLYNIFAITYRLFDRIIVLGRDMQELASQKIGGHGQPPLIIPNWGDVDEVYPIERSENSFAKEHGLVQKTVIQFSGNLGRTHDLETVMRAAKQLEDESDIVFLFVGYGGKAHLIDPASGGSNLPNVRLLPRQPRDTLGAMLSCSDATIIAFVDEMAGVSVPSRMYNIMAAGVPIIAMCDSRSELAQTVTEHDCGWVLDTGQEADLVKKVRQIHRARSETISFVKAHRKGANGRKAAEQFYNPNTIIAVYLALTDSLLPKRPT